MPSFDAGFVSGSIGNSATASWRLPYGGGDVSWKQELVIGGRCGLGNIAPLLVCTTVGGTISELLGFQGLHPSHRTVPPRADALTLCR